MIVNNIQTICFCITGLLGNEILIYLLTTAALVVVILLCTACKYRFKRLKANFWIYRSSVKIRNQQEHQLPEIHLEDTEGVYEVIDESNMIDNIGFKRDCIAFSFDTTN